MKQLIVLLSTIILGLGIVGCILGENGIFDSMKVLWAKEIEVRNMQVVGP